MKVSEMYLTIDIGGTNIRARIWQFNKHLQQDVCVNRKQFSSSRNAIDEIHSFISENNNKIAAGCIAVAGPVQKGRVKLTNVDISLDEKDFSIPIRIINDMEAAGYGISKLSTSNIHQIREGYLSDDGIKTLIKAGVKIIVQPGGSIRDQEVIKTANKARLKMLFTGIRHFNH